MTTLISRKGGPHLFILFLVSTVSAAPPKVNGTSERLGPFPILRVWGTPQEMGFAHGYLLAEHIIGIAGADIQTSDPETIARYDAMRRQLVSHVELDDRIKTELSAIVDGVLEKLGDHAIVQPFNRKISLDDLILLNAGDLLRAFGCSGFTVWGDIAGTWEIITTRNFDYPMPGKMGVEAQMILVRTPDHERHAVATITWPGYIGAYNGFNDAGVCTFMHDGTGGQKAEVSQPVTPMGLTLTSILEVSDGAQAHDHAQRVIEGGGAYPFSYMVRVVSPMANGNPPTPEWVFRVDPSGTGRNAVGEQTCITTNHYLEEGLQPAARANRWSLTRYGRIQDKLSSPIDPEKAWTIQGSVASAEQSFPTD